MNKHIKQNKEKDSFYVVDINNVKERIDLWRKLLPRVEIFYATKANNNDKIFEVCIKE